jgi:pyruvate kinase
MTKQYIDIKRQTKIVATIGGASQSLEVLTELAKAGLNVARMNMSHGDHVEHGMKIANVRQVSANLNAHLAVLVDLAGPKIRIGDFDTEKVLLVEGKKIIFTTEKIIGNVNRVHINYEKLPQELKKGNVIMLNDGKQKLVVEKIEGKEIFCKILVGGEVRGRRGVNLPGAYLSVSAITAKDKKDVDFAILQKAEFIGVSFVRTGKDILDLKKILSKHPLLKQGGAGVVMPKIIAKIETEESIENFDEILAEVDGIMVARGDLAVEVPKEKVPVLQKKMIQKANEAGKFIITATQMLSSMQFSPVPTRAEVSDVANAIFDGTDAVMLSEESAVGQFPVLAVQTMREIAEETDAHNDPRHEFLDFQEVDAIKRSAVELAQDINAKCIIALTETGSTPFKISRFKNNIPIIAITDKKEIINFLSLAHGVSVIEHETIHNMQELRESIKEVAKECGIAKKGDKIVVVSGLTFGTSGSSNMLFVETV